MTSPGPWPAITGIAYGGDYNPEQWPRETWFEDMALMREAGVNFVSVGIFSWALLEPKEGLFEFAWLDDLLDLLHENGIGADLGTPTASPPAWFFAEHPDARVISREGHVMGFGSRGMASHSHPAYREAAVRIASALAERYGKHPAVKMWHIHNEYGVPVGEDYSPASVAAFRSWLQSTYSSLDALNDAWGTAFWGQRYEDWEHIGAPAVAPSVVNPAQRLDFARFTDDQLLECFKAERDAIRVHASQPITTNLMANQSYTTDLWHWAGEMDIIANDHYLTAADPNGHIGLALAADLTRSLAGGKPWILLEHSTSAVNWQPRNVAKRPKELIRNSMQHYARGADAVMFFQWRASRKGAEKFHSAMLPHAGASSRVFREVVDLGAKLGAVAETQGSRVSAEVAMLWDSVSIWAQRLEWRPSEDVEPTDTIRAYYEALWRDGVTTDFVHPEGDLSGYRLVVVPATYLLTRAAAQNLTEFAREGGTVLVSFFSGAVDEYDAVHEGGFLAPLKELLGTTVEEYLPLREGVRAGIAYGPDAALTLEGDVWQEDLALAGAEVKGTYLAGPGVGKAAITRNQIGEGTGWYVSARLGADDLRRIFADVYKDAGIVPPDPEHDLEIVTRHGDNQDFVIAINHSDDAVAVNATGTNLLTGEEFAGEWELGAGDVAVLRAAAAPEGGGR